MVNSEKGFTLIELMIIIAILAIFGGMVFTFIINSNNFSKKTYKNYTSRSEARIAMSYVTFKIRQNNAVNAIEIGKSGDKIEIKDRTRKVICQIVFKDKSLKEILEGEDEKEIAKIDSFLISNIDDKSIQIKIGYTDSFGTKEITETITNRCSK